MIDKRLLTIRLVEPNIKILTILLLNRNYYIKVYITSPKDEKDTFIPCELNITDYKGVQIYSNKFYNACIEKFKCEGIETLQDDVCYCIISLEFSTKSNRIFYIELNEIESKTIDNLNISQNRKQEIYKIIDNYLKENFEDAINNICIFGEFITKELAKKIQNKNMEFRTALNILTNHKMTEKTKINYNYLGSLLYPIYYVRNQKLHPYSKIEFDENIAELVFLSLSRIIDYISENQIKI